ncbi:MAG: NAD-glutamate dehydrogenase [Lysobacterales bacterium]
MTKIITAGLREQTLQRLALAAKASESRWANTFAEHFLAHVPDAELQTQSADFWASAIGAQMNMLRQRIKSQVSIEIYNPPEDQGDHQRHTVLDVMSDDRPFLVDSVTLAISEAGRSVRRVIHPVYRVSRDAGGFLMGLSHGKADPELGPAESVMHFHIERISDGAEIAALKQRIATHLEDVRMAVDDWQAMSDQALDVSQQVTTAISPFGQERQQETAEFLRWLVDAHFTFLGYRHYVLQQADGEFDLQPQTRSGLGILREEGRLRKPPRLTRLKTGSARELSDTSPIVLTKAGVRSTVHRSGFLDYVGVMIFDAAGNLVGEHRFLGLYTSSAYNRRPWNIPLVRKNVDALMERSLYAPDSHGGKALLHIAETLPRDELFQSGPDELFRTATGVFELAERRQTRLLLRQDRFGRFYSCLVYLPRERFNTETREKLQEILLNTLGGSRLDYTVQLDDSVLARLHVMVWVDPDQPSEFDREQLQSELADAVRSWTDRLTDILIEKHGEETGQAWGKYYGEAFPAAYVEDVAPWVAAFDVEKLAKLESENDLELSLYRPRVQPTGKFRFKVFRWDTTIALSDVLPILENLGLRVVSERPYRLEVSPGSLRWVQDFDIILASGGDLDLEHVRTPFQEGFEQVVRGLLESDGFNRLILGAGLNWRQVVLLRAYCRYWRQTRCPYSQQYIEQSLARHPHHAALLVTLFAARFDPELDASADAEKLSDPVRNHQLARMLERLRSPAAALGLLPADGKDFSASSRAELLKLCRSLMNASLAQVRSSDEDRILRSFSELIDATLRSNAYQGALDDPTRGYVSLKFDSAKVPDLPRPFPWREIFVYSPQVEGIHLRGGPVSRGGLRWSDRFEDFRTEVLGLMKAQTVKNTMIVPVGAKGGFVARNIKSGSDRDTTMAAVVASYRRFINGLLDITDNLTEQGVQHPAQVVRHDDDDPYLVVAADKGTATFSDIANAVAADHQFWLGDAFASGGSVGYDHKKMAITAKGAWESVKRHFRELGLNCQKEPFTVVGIGDMAGDVFGNGMLLSRQICLRAAFNHEHIFLDPDPDPISSFTERQRLFETPRSSWSDYSAELISQGGGVFSRQDKTIEVSEAVASWLGIKAAPMSPNQLIRALLKAPADLLWNGGIGTYVKASTETDLAVGDRSNDALRVNGEDLRFRVIGEGGNLGLTQRGRIEFAAGGGRINTDFIDNAGGVDCSDHEVNIKILLNQAVEAGRINDAERVELLSSMTHEVSSLVLKNNYLQSQALSLMEAHTVPRLGSKAHMISTLESVGILDRQLEALPSDEDLHQRQGQGRGLLRPELAVLLSYSKITLYQDLMASDIPEDQYLARELTGYFPEALRERFADLAKQHRLRREIIATVVTNSMVNRMGATFCLRIGEETGAGPADVAKAYTAAREIFSARDIWSAVEATDNQVASAHQIEAHLTVWNLLRHATRWLLHHSRGELDIAAVVERYQAPALMLSRGIVGWLPGATNKRVSGYRARLTNGGFSEQLVETLVSCSQLKPALDILEVATETGCELEPVARSYFKLGQHLKLAWLMQQIEQLPVDSQWHAAARGALRDELFQRQRQLTARVLSGHFTPDGADPVKSWLVAADSEVRRFGHMMTDMRAGGAADYAKASVAVRGLDRLLNTADG